MIRGSNKPVIAVITPSLGLGGAEQWVRLLVTYCKDFNWIVGVLSDYPHHPIIANAVADNVVELHGPEKIHSKVIAHKHYNETVAAAVQNADAVIVWGGGDYWPIPTSAPVIFVGHGTCQWTTAATKQAQKGGATHFVGVSENVGAALRTVVSNVRVIMNGVDTTRLQSPPDKQKVREEWKNNNYDYAKYVGYIGRLGNEKNIDSIIHAVASLPYHYHLVFIGCTGWKAESILKLARTVLRERLIEVKAEDNVGKSLWALDCAVQVSPREGHSLAICEMLLCRTPIVSTMTGALPQLEKMAGTELVEHMPDDPLTNEIASAIRKVCTKPPVARIDAAEKFAQQYLTAEKMCRDWTAYLREIMASWKYKPKVSVFAALKAAAVQTPKIATRYLPAEPVSSPPKVVVSDIDEQWFCNMPADDNKCQFVRAHATDWRLHVFPKIAQKHGKLRWLEIGSLEGWSGSWVADHVLKPGDTLTCVDIWPRPETEAKFDAKLRGRAEKYKMKSADFLARAVADGKQYDVIYIDGDHEAKAVLSDFVLAWYLAPIGGIIILDDYPLQFKAPAQTIPPAPAVDAILHIYGTRMRVLHKAWQVILEKTWDR